MGKKILVIDDNKSFTKSICDFLKTHEFEAEFASEGKEALEMVDNFQPDLIVLDILMPCMDGYSFLKLLKGKPIWPIPIIVVTAKEKLRDLFEVEGIAGYLVKPVDGDRLLGVINSHLPQNQ